MAQELNQQRTPAAYAGVLHFAQTHTGEAAAAAYLALGHAYYIDKQNDLAVHYLQDAAARSSALDDYVAYLGALADEQAGHPQQSLTLLNGFADKYPDSIFVANLPVAVARMQLEAGQPAAALATVNAARAALGGRVDFQYLDARVQMANGNQLAAAQQYKSIYKNFPLTTEAKECRDALIALASTGVSLSIADRHEHADALYGAKRYAEAADAYNYLAHDPDVTNPTTRNDLLIDAAACDLKLKRLTAAQLEGLPDTQDDHGAERLYLLMEAARDRNDSVRQKAIVEDMLARFPTSDWLLEALFSSGNMYLLSRDFPTAIHYYALIVQNFPRSRYTDLSHWHMAWLNYRLGNYTLAGQQFDEQIVHFASGDELPDALYWRGRELEEQEHDSARAKSYYTALTTAYRNYYFALEAKKRLPALAGVTAEPVAILAGIHAHVPAHLTDSIPEDDIHVVKARILVNAGLNEYIAPELREASDSAEWAGYAEALLYSTAGETFHALQIMKRNTPSYYAVPIESIPRTYWDILFPKPYWSAIRDNSQRNNLDPYLVVSLMRQESEFNPGVISYANAYGLMQLLPSVGRAMAKKDGARHFTDTELLNPATNIQLGTLYLRQTMDKFNNTVEFTLAAYNAGDDRVIEWNAEGHFRDIPEFVESIPFTQTREYVQAIVRNAAMYRRLDGVAQE
jgi:soluble lytic murein transglycosylase